MNTVDELFVGEVVAGVPEVAGEYGRKAPGDQDGDNQGDLCH
jgi:hypothetical protein